ncbi:MAG TPA: hypothetical protein VHA06_15620 [Candidatus Angelobacter sp.]|nr:hypothetical protein [Candidatus Angelobacter sp.]
MAKNRAKCGFYRPLWEQVNARGAILLKQFSSGFKVAKGAWVNGCSVSEEMIL